MKGGFVYSPNAIRFQEHYDTPYGLTDLGYEEEQGTWLCSRDVNNPPIYRPTFRSYLSALVA